MKSKYRLGILLCASLCVATLNAQKVVESFEYTTPDEAAAAWAGSANAVVSSSADKASTAPGTSSLQLTFNFPSVEWATESARGPVLAEPVSIAAEKYVSFRIKGDPAFQAADFRNLYLYAYDADGKFGRWGGPVPVSDSWQVVNYLASSIEKPWDSPELPNLNQIVQFAFFQYGSQTAIAAYSATIGIDDLEVRDAPLVEVPATQEFMIEDFEYATVDVLLTEWTLSANAVASVSDNVAFRATGLKSMRVDFSFPSSAWATETINGVALATPISIGADQYVSFRIKGDPAFAAADFRDLYLYVYDVDGNFGRWGGPAPTSADWAVWNFRAGTIQKPWDSPNLPNLAQIARLAFFQYGSETAIPAYNASIQIDEIRVRNSPLTEFPAPSGPRGLIESFESYSGSEALLGAYSYMNSPATTVTTASIESAGQASKVLKLQIDFSGGQYPWGSVRSLPVAAFSIPTNGVVSLRVKGDPSLASVADAATSFWLSFYDSGARPTHLIIPASTVTNADWTTISATLADFTDYSGVDIGNIVQWRILVQGWEGTAENAPMSGTFYVDDIKIDTAVAAPSVAIARDGDGVIVSWPATATGYALEGAPSLGATGWEPVTGGTGNSVTIKPAQGIRFYRLKK